MEQGTHEQLLEKRGIYYDLVQAQSLKQLERQRRKTDVSSPQEMAQIAMAGQVEVSEEEDDVENLLEPTAPGATLKRMQLNRVATADLIKQQEEEKKKQLESEMEKYKNQPSPWGRLAQVNSPEWPYIIVGCIGAAINGVVMPIFSIIFARILNVFAPGNPNMREEANFYAGMFVVLGVAQMIAQIMQIGCFGISGELMTKRLRLACFASLMYQEIGFFDEDRNSTGALTTKLADEATQVKGLTGQLMGTLISMAITLIAALSIAFANSWKLSLVIVACIPLVAFSGVMRMRAMSGFNSKTKEMYEQAGTVANEAIDNVRCVRV